MPARTAPELTPGEWAVLGAVAEAPTHGFALARLLGPGGPLGRVWTLPRPVVYQALKKLTQLELVIPGVVERSERGPNRTLMEVTPSGRRAVQGWLAAPVEHVRDIRSELLLKLALLERAGSDAQPLVSGQREVIEARREVMGREAAGAAGFDRVLAAWRMASLEGVLTFLDSIGGGSGRPR